VWRFFISGKFAGFFIDANEKKGTIMSRQIQLRRGTTAQNNAFTGAVGEVTVDTEKKTLRVHDGETRGGTPLAKQADILPTVITATQKQQNGYVKFANGLIIQWGRIPEITQTSGVAFSLPIPFTATTYAISGNDPTVKYSNLQLSTFDAFRTSSGTSTGIRWMAIGY